MANIKPVALQTGHISEEEIENRREAEGKLKGVADKIKPPEHLSKDQKEIFKFIVGELEVSGMLGNLDIFILTSCSIAIDRINTIEKVINEKPALMKNTQLMSSKDKYSKEFFKCCSELSLSPQARAKMASLIIQDKDKAEDPLLKALRDDED